AGVAVGDFDNDGLPDIYFCGLDTPNVLYKNLGNWKFRDVTEQAGLTRPSQYSRGAVFADINGDGFLDLLVATTGNGVFCFLNDGHGKFTNMTSAAGSATSFGSVPMELGQLYGNVTLDLCVGNSLSADSRDY